MLGSCYVRQLGLVDLHLAESVSQRLVKHQVSLGERKLDLVALDGWCDLHLAYRVLRGYVGGRQSWLAQSN